MPGFASRLLSLVLACCGSGGGAVDIGACITLDESIIVGACIAFESVDDGACIALESVDIGVRIAPGRAKNLQA